LGNTLHCQTYKQDIGASRWPFIGKQRKQANDPHHAHLDDHNKFRQVMRLQMITHGLNCGFVVKYTRRAINGEA